MCEVAGIFVGVKLKLNNSNVTVPDMPQALENVSDLLSQHFLDQQPSQQQMLPGGGQVLQPQHQGGMAKQIPGGVGFQQPLPFGTSQAMGGVLPMADEAAVVGDPALGMPPDWDPATMGTMDWTAGYENILNLLQDELQILENYPNAGFF